MGSGFTPLGGGEGDTWPYAALKSINVTALRTAEASLLTRRTAIFIQEHAVPLTLQGGWAKEAIAKGCRLILSPTIPEAAAPKGGVGVLAPSEFRPTQVATLTKAFAKARASGRVM